jgi:hypothetical protein
VRTVAAGFTLQVSKQLLQRAAKRASCERCPQASQLCRMQGLPYWHQNLAVM